jgi:molecular chaperone GrpE
MQDKKSDSSDETIIEEQFLDTDLESKIKEVIEDDVLGDLSEPTYDELMEERETLKDRLMRSLADLENLRKRSERDRKDAELYGGTKLARDLLSVFDNMSRALDNIDDNLRDKASAVVEGLELTQRELLSVFLKHKIDQIEPVEGEKFDPKYHQAMFEAPIPGTERGTIIQVMTKGFKVGDRLLRASQVGVSSNNDPAPSVSKKNQGINNDNPSDMEDKS